MCTKEMWSATGSNTTNWMMDLVSLVQSVIRNLPCLVDHHSHMKSFHLKIKPFTCETCKGLIAHTRSLEPGRYLCMVNAQDLSVSAGKFSKEEEVFKITHARMTAVFLTPETSTAPRGFQIQESAEAS